MVRRASAVRHRGLTGFKVTELLTGEIAYLLVNYDGYGYLDPGGNDLAENHITDAMRADWEANREALLPFWRSGKAESTERSDGLVGIAVWLSQYAAAGGTAFRSGEAKCRKTNLAACLGREHEVDGQTSSALFARGGNPGK